MEEGGQFGGGDEEAVAVLLEAAAAAGDDADGAALGDLVGQVTIDLFDGVAHVRPWGGGTDGVAELAEG
jgi:hypothetical protein